MLGVCWLLKLSDSVIDTCLSSDDIINTEMPFCSSPSTKAFGPRQCLRIQWCFDLNNYIPALGQQRCLVRSVLIKYMAVTGQTAVDVHLSHPKATYDLCMSETGMAVLSSATKTRVA